MPLLCRGISLKGPSGINGGPYQPLFLDMYALEGKFRAGSSFSKRCHIHSQGVCQRRNDTNGYQGSIEIDKGSCGFIYSRCFLGNSGGILHSPHQPLTHILNDRSKECVTLVFHLWSGMKFEQWMT